MGRQSEADFYDNKYIELAKSSTVDLYIELLIERLMEKGRFEEAKEQVERAKKLPSFKDKEELKIYETIIEKSNEF